MPQLAPATLTLLTMTRRGEAQGPAKLASPIADYTAGAWRSPVTTPFRQHCLSFRTVAQNRADRRAAQHSMLLRVKTRCKPCNDAKAVALHATCFSKLLHLPAALDLVQLRRAVNDTLLASACEVFPERKRSDTRVCAQQPFRASAQHTCSLYGQDRRPGPRSLLRLIFQWRYLLLVPRQQIQHLKKTFYLDPSGCVG